jgi:hypothetical protein
MANTTLQKQQLIAQNSSNLHVRKVAGPFAHFSANLGAKGNVNVK